jgi:hypothetical protein
MDETDRSERVIAISIDQFALGIAAAYVLNLATAAIIVMGVFAFAGVLSLFGHVADPAAHPSTRDIVIGTAIICVLLIIGVLLLLWGAKAILRRKPWQTGMFLVLLSCCLFFLFRAGPQGGFTLVSVLALVSVALLVLHWKRIFVQRRD